MDKKIFKDEGIMNQEQNVRIDVVPRLSRQQRRDLERQICPRSLEMMNAIYKKSGHVDEYVWDDYITIVQDIPELPDEDYIRILCPDDYLKKMLIFAFFTACHNVLARRIVASGHDLDDDDAFIQSYWIRKEYGNVIKEEIFKVCNYSVDIDLKNGYMWVHEEDKMKLVLAGIIDIGD